MENIYKLIETPSKKIHVFAIILLIVGLSIQAALFGYLGEDTKDTKMDSVKTSKYLNLIISSTVFILAFILYEIARDISIFKWLNE